MRRDPFDQVLLTTIQTLVTQHHTIYPSLPPQGVFFEALALRAFHLSGRPDALIEQTSPNTAQHDLLVGAERISLKSETGVGTRPDLITITKLCTTEREPWDPAVLVGRVMDHLSRYDSNPDAPDAVESRAGSHTLPSSRAATPPSPVDSHSPP